MIELATKFNQWEFGRLLEWHLQHGTRPRLPAKVWSLKEFAHEVGVDVRTIRNWIGQKNKPNSIVGLENALFGTSEAARSRSADDIDILREAFRRLAVSQGSALSRPDNATIFSNMPPFPRLFTGRAKYIRLLDQALIRMRQSHLSAFARRVAITGLPGIGKSSIAAKYAYSHANSYARILWVNADSRRTLVSALASIASEFHATPTAESDEVAARTILTAFESGTEKVLLIYDNAESPDLVRDFLPSAMVHVIITSRFPDWDLWAEPIDVQIWEVPEATDFLLVRTGRDDGIGAGYLAHRLGRLPLALDHAGAFCRRAGVSFVAYAERVDELIRSVPRGVQYPRSVFATFQLAIEAAAAISPIARSIVYLVAITSAEPLPIKIIKAALNDWSNVDRGVGALAEASLITIQGEGEAATVQAHRLVKAVARDIALPLREASALSRAFGAALADVFPSGAYNDPSKWEACRALTPHVLSWWADHRKENDPRLIDLLAATGGYLQARAAYPEANALREDVLAACEVEFGADHIKTASALSDLALLAYDKGDPKASIPIYRSALRRLRAAQGRGGLEEAEVLNNLGMALWAVNRPRPAKVFVYRALSIRRMKLHDRSSLIAQSLNNLGLIECDLGNYLESELFYRESISLYIEDELSTNPWAAQALSNLANTLRRLDRMPEAVELSSKAFAVWERAHGPLHPETNRGRANLAKAYSLTGRLAEARSLAVEARRNLARALGPGSDWVEYCDEILASLGGG